MCLGASPAAAGGTGRSGTLGLEGPWCADEPASLCLLLHAGAGEPCLPRRVRHCRRGDRSVQRIITKCGALLISVYCGFVSEQRVSTVIPNVLNAESRRI